MNRGTWTAEQIERWDVEKLTPYDKNARTHSEKQIEQIAASIEEFGFTNPILATGNGRIVAGHGRLEAAKKLGFRDVPVVVVDHLTQDQIKAYTLADNKLALNAGWDNDLLSVELSELAATGYDISLIGFDEGELAELLGNAESELEGDPDEVPELEEVAITQPGDLWLMGEHRLFCGDAAKIADVSTVLNDEKANALITDPPYGVSYADKNKYLNKVDKGAKNQTPIESDHMSAEKLKEFLQNVMKAADQSVQSGGAIYVFAPPGKEFNVFGDVLLNFGYWRQTLIWVKSNFVLGRSDYKYQHEPIFYGWKPGAAHNYYGPLNQSSVFDDIKPKDLAKLKKEELINYARQLEDRLVSTPTDVIREDKPFRSEEHPTMKPVKLIARLVSNSTKAGDLIYEPFMGSGTTMITAQMLGRRCYGLEISPNYCDVIVKRWQQLTGKEAINEKTGERFNDVLKRG